MLKKRKSMELDEMKNTWETLDNRLNKIQLLQDSLIREMMQTKVNKRIDRLRNWEILGAAVVIFVIPFIAYLYLTYNWDFPAWHIFLILAFIVCVGLSFWQISKVQRLLKIDYSKNISENIIHINRFKIQYEKEKLIMNFITPVFFIFIVINYAYMGAQLSKWILMICVLLFAAIYNYWAYKIMIKRKIPTILKSMEELKELEEE